MNGNLEAYLARQRARHGDRFDASTLDDRFAPYYGTGRRIKVKTCGLVMTGTVSATTGWAPAFLLMRTSRAMGSPWILGRRDELLAVKVGRTYQAVAK